MAAPGAPLRRSGRPRTTPARYREPQSQHPDGEGQLETPRRARQPRRGAGGPGADPAAAEEGDGGQRGRAPRQSAAQIFEREGQVSAATAAPPSPVLLQSTEMFRTPPSSPSSPSATSAPAPSLENSSMAVPPPSPRLREAGLPFTRQQSPPRPQPPASQPPGPSQEGEAATQLPAEDRLPSLDTILQTFKPTLTHVPTSVASEWARVLTSLADRIAGDPGNVSNWKSWMMVTFCIFPSFKRDKRTRRADGDLSTAQQIRRRLVRWRSGEQSELWAEAMELTRLARKRPQQKKLTEEELMDLNARRAVQKVGEGELSKAMEALTSAGLAPPTAENARKMEDLHPRGNPPAARTTEEAQVKITVEDLKKAVASLKSGAAAGPDSHKPSHYRAALGPAAGARQHGALAAVTRMINVILEGGVPVEVRPFFAAGTLHAVPKRDGKIRPINCGNLIRRLATKCAVRKVISKAADILSPHQLGCGVQNGCEAIIHAANLIIQEDPSLLIMQADLTNAFQNIERDVMLQEVKEQIPEILNICSTCYETESFLYFGTNVLKSSRGVGQGCPLSVVIFSLLLMPVILEIQARVPTLRMNSWLMDDSTIIGKKEELKVALEVLLEKGPERGLIVSTDHTVPDNGGKSTVWSPSFNEDTAADPLGYGIKRVTEDGIVLLGAALGSEDFVRRHVAKLTDKIGDLTAQLPRLQDSMSSLLVLRSCLSLGKFGYTTRTTDLTSHGAALSKFDGIQRDALTAIIGTPLNPQSYQQACLPVSLGGLGVKQSQDHATSAYCASVISSVKLITRIIGGHGEAEADEETEAGAGMGDEEVRGVESGRGDERGRGDEAVLGAEARLSDEDGAGAEAEAAYGSEEWVAARFLTPAVLAALSERIGEEMSLALLLAGGVNQKQLSRKIDERLQKQLSESFDSAREKARLAALCQEKCSQFLNCIPMRRLGLHIRSQEFVALLKYRLGIPLYPQNSKCPECHQPMDSLGDHSLSCHHAGGLTRRHDAVKMAIYRIAQSAGLGPVLEAQHLLDDGRKPGDITIEFYGDAGAAAAYDITGINSLRSDLVERAVSDPKKVVQIAHEKKERSVGAQLRAEGISFHPIAFTSLGLWHRVAVTEISKLVKSKCLRLGLEEKKTLDQEFKILSVVIQKGNARMLVGRQTFPSNEENIPDINV